MKQLLFDFATEGDVDALQKKKRKPKPQRKNGAQKQLVFEFAGVGFIGNRRIDRRQLQEYRKRIQQRADQIGEAQKRSGIDE